MPKDDEWDDAWPVRACNAPLRKYRRGDFGAAAEGLRRALAGHGTTAKPERQTQEGWQIRRIKNLLPIAFPPDGHPPSDLTLQAIQTRLRPLFEKGLKVPSTDSIARALGRRGRRG